MLALSTMSISLPMERFQPQHPSGEDGKFPDTLKQLKDLYKQQFLESPLYTGSGWYYDEWDGEDYFWEGKIANPTPIETYVKRPNSLFDVNRLLRHLRNALSHGNIFFGGSGNIEDIVFLTMKKGKVSKDLKNQCFKAIENVSGREADALRKAVDGAATEEGRYAYLMTSPKHFEDFLYKWFDFVSGFGAPDSRIYGDYAEAAD